jgi:hypothetical protein
MAAPTPEREPVGKTPPEDQRTPIFVDEVDEFHKFVDHDTRGEPGYVPLRQMSIVPRIEKPFQSPGSSERT